MRQTDWAQGRDTQIRYPYGIQTLTNTHVHVPSIRTKSIPIMTTNRLFLNSKIVFSVSLVVLAFVVIGIWGIGIKDHQTIEHNALLSLTILSISFFLFITLGLYYGAKLKDTIGNPITEILKRKILKRRKLKAGDITKESLSHSEIPMEHFTEHFAESFTEGFVEVFAEGGLIGFIVAIVLWIFFSVVLGFLLWFFGAIFWVLGAVIIAMLYWVFFRAIRLVLKNAAVCKGDLMKSAWIGLKYTFFYSSWMYALIFLLLKIH